MRENPYFESTQFWNRKALAYRRALQDTIPILKWWSKDYPNDGEYTRKSYELLKQIESLLDSPISTGNPSSATVEEKIK